MPTNTPKFRNRGEATAWSRDRAAVLNRFNWPAKRKANVDFVIRLADDIADKALLSFRKRSERNGK